MKGKKNERRIHPGADGFISVMSLMPTAPEAHPLPEISCLVDIVWTMSLGVASGYIYLVSGASINLFSALINVDCFV